AIHLAVVVFEDTQTSNFLGQIRCVSLGVFVTHAQEYQQSQANLAADPLVAGPIVDADLGTADALYDGTHGICLVLTSIVASIVRPAGNLTHDPRHTASVPPDIYT